MSTLLIDELYPGVVFSQNFKITRNTNIAHIRPWIYVEGTLVDGQFQVEIKDGATSLATKTITHAQINAFKNDTYAHGFIRFDFNSLVLNVPSGASEKEYTIEFSMIGHTLDLNNYLAIVRRWDGKVYPRYGDVVAGEAVNDSIEPAGFELYEYRGV